MASLLLDYSLDKNNISNPNGSYPATFSNVTQIAGPGNTSMGSYLHALDFGTKGKAQIDLTSLGVNMNQFCIRLIFKLTNSPTARQNLAESTWLPFSVYIDKPENPGGFDLHFSLGTKSQGWSGPDTVFKKTLVLNKWYVFSFCYDFDTAAIFIDDDLLTLHAFPDGSLKPGTNKKLFIGTWVDGVKHQFKGQMAAFQWYNGMPASFDSLIDEKRNESEWFITHKYESFRKTYNVGKRTKKIIYVPATGAFIQYYQNCAISFHDSLGCAFEIHGAIYTHYKVLPKATELGFLVSDEVDTTKPGGKKSLFSNGGIYWSGATGARSVKGQIYLDYEHNGESKFLGFPTHSETTIPGGKSQIFQGGRMYYKNGDSNAHEVHGAILAKYLATGAHTKWGFPVTNETDLKNGSTVIGKISEFEGCSIIWKASTGAHEIHGEIRKKYLELKGVLSGLGFPTSDETDIPAYSGTGKMNTFENGSILWYGSYNSIVVARPFTIFLGRINSKENEGWGMGQNDLYLRVKIRENGNQVYNKRYPNSGDYGNHNVKTLNKEFPVTFVPNQINKVITFDVDIWDADPGDDDHLGHLVYDLKAANGWGFAHDQGIFTSTFSKINSMTWSVKAKVNLDSLTETEKWWGVKNKGTNQIQWSQCAAAFRDIDSETEWWDVTDWVQKAFYELAVKDIAKGGNCFGMSVEGIHARKGTSLFGMPINLFNVWKNPLVNEFNIKHCYQVSAGAIWWFLGQFLSGNTHDPKDVFNLTNWEHSRGNNPVLCIAQNYNFSGAPHCILPVAWDTTSKPWKITICDPNFPNQLKTLTVNPDNNTFHYAGGSTYSGGQWSGGRLHYMPFSLFSSVPRTPVWDAIQLLLCGTIMIFGDQAETSSIKDSTGKDLDAHGSRAKMQMQNGQAADEYFIQFNPFNPGPTAKSGKVLLRKEDKFSKAPATGIGVFSHLTIGSLAKDRRTGTLNTMLRSSAKAAKLVTNRLPHFVVKDATTMAKIPANIRDAIYGLAVINSPRNFVHKIKCTASGSEEYLLKHNLTEVKVGIPMLINEHHSFEIADLGTHKMTMKIKSQKDKKIKLQIKSKIGVHGDFIQYDFDQIAISASKDLELNIKQGFGGLELVNPSMVGNLPVTIKTKLNGIQNLKTIQLPVDKGIRIKPGEFMSNKLVTVSKIDTLFGPRKDSTRF